MPPSPRAQRHLVFTDRIAQEYARSKGRSGRRQIRRQLQRRGLAISAYMVQTVMHEQGLRAHRGNRRYPKPTGIIVTMPNRLWSAGQPRCFTSTAPGTRLVGDTTEFDLVGQRVYFHVVLDLFDRRVLGWSLTTKPDAIGFIAAMTKAVTTGRLGTKPIFHSDHGSHFTSRAFQAWCDDHGILQSMGSKGDCYDNAVVESFFATFKGDLIGASGCRTWEDAIVWITEWVEVWYNTERPHSWNQGRAPIGLSDSEIPLSLLST